MGSPVKIALSALLFALATGQAAPWQRAFDLDGDGPHDAIVVTYTGGAHCCYRLAVQLTSTGQTIDLPFLLDGGYVHGLDLDRPASFDVRKLDGPLPELAMTIATYDGQPQPLPRAWQRRYGIHTHHIAIGFAGARLHVRDLPDTVPRGHHPHDERREGDRATPRVPNVMRISVLFALAALLAQPAFAATIEDSGHATTGYIRTDGTIEDSSHATTGYIRSDGTIEDRHHATIGYIAAGTVENASHSTIGYVGGDGTVENASHATIGYIRTDGTVEDSHHATIGHAAAVPRAWAAVVFFFFKL